VFCHHINPFYEFVLVNLPSLCALLGITLDIFGAVGLYFTKIRGLGKIRTQELNSLRRTHIVRPGNEADVIRNEIQNEINTIIATTNKANDEAHRASRVWLYLLIAGFLLQFISAFLQIKITA